MMCDMGAALPDDDTLDLVEPPGRFGSVDCATVALLLWKRPSGSLAQLDEDIAGFFSRVREADGIVERRCWRDRNMVVFNIFASVQDSHCHCVQVRVKGADMERVLAAEPGQGQSSDSSEQSKNALSLHLPRQHWKNH
jgi:hypothetical protein